MKKFSIVYIIFRTRENTGSKVVFHHALAFRKKGYDVKIYTLFGKPASWFPPQITTYSIFSSFFHSRPDVLVATFWPTVYVAFFLRARKKCYLIMGWEEDFYSHPLLRFFARLTYKLPIKKIVLSDYLRKRLQKYNKHEKNISKIDTYPLSPSLYNKGIRKYNHSSDNSRRKRIHILSVISWYNRYKGPDLLVEAIQKLKKNHPEYYFTVVGREKMSYSPLIDRFLSNPPSSKIADLYRESDVLLITSRVEGFYIPGIEAMASGCPVISTNCGGISEYAIHNYNCIIMNSSISELWEQDLIEKILKDRKLTRRLVANGRETAKKYQNLTWDDITKSLEKIYFNFN